MVQLSTFAVLNTIFFALYFKLLSSRNGIYEEVTKQMRETEPGVINVDCCFDEKTGVLLVSDLFKDSGVVGQHLGTTAAGHFPSLLQIADPGPFLFCGDLLVMGL